MKKSSFIAMMMGTVAGILFALGMCMALLPEWNAFLPGVVLGVVGIVLGIITIIVWRKMEHKDPVKISKKAARIIAVSIIGALVLGIGMCFAMVWNQIVLGTLIGILGIILLLFLVPITKGLK